MNKIVSLEKLNMLTAVQQQNLHECIGKFLSNRIQKISDVGLIDETILAEYIAKTTVLQKELYLKKTDLTLNGVLYGIILAAEKKNTEGEAVEVISQLIQNFTSCYQQMKNLDVSLELIRSFQKQNVKIAEFNQIPSAKTKIRLEDDVFYIDYSLSATKQSWELIQGLNNLNIDLNGKQYVAGSEDFYIESMEYGNGEEECCIGKIRVNRLTESEYTETKKAYFRCMIPIGSVDWDRDILTYSAYIKNGWRRGLIELKDGKTQLHVYPGCDGDRKYMIVESLTKTTEKQILEYVYSISLTLGFITGNIHLGMCYVFSSSEPEFGVNVMLAYHTMRSSSKNGIRIFTTNMYDVRETLRVNKVDLQSQTQFYDNDGKFREHLQDCLQPNVLQSLFMLIHKDEKIARAVVSIVESVNLPLEYQASVCAIVIEILAHSVPGPKPIPDDKLWRKIKADLKKVVDRYVVNEAEEQQISEESIAILGKRIKNMNNPTNADLLAKSFVGVGYELTPNDKDALKMRNTFLHGGLIKGSVEKQNNELFYLALTLHKLGCIIILKKAGFSGYILNNPVLFNCEKAVAAGEKALLSI